MRVVIDNIGKVRNANVALDSITTIAGSKTESGNEITYGGNYSHAEGQGTEAVGLNSHAEGIGTITPNIMGAHVQGRYNSNLYNNNLVDIVG